MKTHYTQIHYTILAFTVTFFLVSCSGTKKPDADLYKQSAEQVGRLVTKNLLSRSEFMMYKTADVNAVHYAEACAGYGAVKLGALLQDTQLIQKLVERYERVITDSLPNTANHVDANVYGVLPLELYLHTSNEKYLAQGLEFAKGQWRNPQADGLTNQTRYWIDDVYMINSLQVQAYRATGKMIYLDRAALQTHSYIRKLQQPNGLFFHGADAPFFWGRGNGWVAAGFAELLTELPESNPHYPAIVKAYRKMMNTLLECQDEDGMWHQLIDYKESFKETSSTAMFGYAFAVGVQKGILPEEPYQSAYLKAWNALSEYIDEEGRIGEVCVGTGQSDDVNYYLKRPRIAGDLHGQAPVLWLACSILQNFQ